MKLFTARGLRDVKAVQRAVGVENCCLGVIVGLSPRGPAMNIYGNKLEYEG